MLYKKKIKASAIMILLSGMFSQPLYAEEVQALVVTYNCPDGSIVPLDQRSSCPAVVQVPEPSTLAVFTLGIMGLALRRLKNTPKN